MPVKLSLSISLIVVLAGAFISGCKKSGSDTSLVVLNIFPHVGADTLILGKTYANPSGRNVTFTRAQYFISDINLVRTDGSLQSITGVLEVSPQTTQYILGTVPIGTYKSIEFSVGVDPTLNHIDPTAQTAGSPLTDATMHFAADSLGYIFLAVEGYTDTSASGTGVPNVNYSYHIGADALFESVPLPDHSAAPYNAAFSANGNKLVTINVVADMNVLLKNLNMKSSLITNTADYPVLADTIAAHISAAFSYQQ